MLRTTKERAHADGQLTPDLFADFNGVPKGIDKTEFYQHDQNWSNRMILGDSLQVMASLAEREGLRGKVQCIYLDPPYGIKFNSNFQWSTTSRDVKDGSVNHITREPEQVKAFRDTWREGIHSYLTYLRDRLSIARDLLDEKGSIFVQIGDENMHRVRALMDEVFGDNNFVQIIIIAKTSGLESTEALPSTADFVLWYSKGHSQKYRQLWLQNKTAGAGGYNYVQNYDGAIVRVAEISGALPAGSRPFASSDITKPGPGSKFTFAYRGQAFSSGNRWWGTTPESLDVFSKANRIIPVGERLRFKRFLDDFPVKALNNSWDDTSTGSFTDSKVYVVQTANKIIERCILMTTDPGDLVLDPTCGSGTTAFVAEQWGRRWITIDTSRVALALARARIMGARYPFYFLSDSVEGRLKETEVGQSTPSSQPVHGNIRHGFVYERGQPWEQRDDNHCLSSDIRCQL